MSTYQVNTHPGSHLAGAPDGSANLGPQRPRTKGKAGWDFFSLACTDWPWLVTLQTWYLKARVDTCKLHYEPN